MFGGFAAGGGVGRCCLCAIGIVADDDVAGADAAFGNTALTAAVAAVADAAVDTVFSGDGLDGGCRQQVRFGRGFGR
ncbi:hypothetical protein [Neisseria yangbaofengii]|uniref:hypothetical protein n=1 Tax=Neisseria yangbaofengii TaxID=2709396 RepID=UPI003B9E829F